MQTNLPPDEPPALRTGDRLQRALVVALPVACLVSAIAMLVQIEVLVGFFPACGMIGLALAVAAAPLRRRSVIRFGASAPIAASACAATISAFSLSPGEAYVPINMMWSLYTVGLIAVCWWPIRQAWSRPTGMPRPNRSTWRFSIRSMLLLTSATAVLLTVGKLFGLAMIEFIARILSHSGFAFSALLGIASTGLAIAHGVSHRRRGVGLFRRTPASAAADRGNTQGYLFGEKMPPETPPPDQDRG